MSSLVRLAINERPRLGKVHQRTKSLELTFVFKASIPSALSEQYPMVHKFLRSTQKEDKKVWTKILRSAYLEKHSSKGKRIRRGLQQYLHLLLKRALLTLLEQAQGTDKTYPGIEKEIGLLREVLSGKRGHPKSKRRQKKDAIRFARLYKKLKPEVTTLRKFGDQYASKDNRVVGQAVEKAFKYKWLGHVIHGTALKHLPTNTSSNVSRESHLTGEWQAWQLTVGVMYEQQDPSKRFEPNTIAKYISIGRRLLREKKLPNKPAA
jgi:hypothetical protein